MKSPNSCEVGAFPVSFTNTVNTTVNATDAPLQSTEIPSGGFSDKNHNSGYPKQNKHPGTIAALNTTEFPQDVADMFDRKLSDLGRLHLLGVGLQICPTDAAITLCHAALTDWCAGRPQAPFWSIPEDAKDWAALASLVERKHYAAAILNSSSAREKAGFLGYAERLPA